MTDAPRADDLRYALLLDTETQGLDASKHATIEIAVCLYDVKHASPRESFSALIRAESNEAEPINGIPAAQLVDAREPEEVWRAVRWLLKPASVIVAHRAEFDQKFVPDFGLPWACTKSDFRWPGKMRGDHLVQLALSLGLGVASAHRAASDVDTLARIFTRIAEKGHSLEALLLDAMRPKQRFVSLAPFEQREIVKAWGFFWNPERKEWYRNMPPEDVAELPFKVRQVSA